MADVASLKEIAGQFRLSDAQRTNPRERRLELQLPQAVSVGESGFTVADITRTVTPAARLPIALNVSFLVKQVRFDDTAMPPAPIAEDATDAEQAAWAAQDTAARKVIGGMPVIAPIPIAGGLSQALPAASLMEGLTNDPGVPGLLGRTQGVVTPTIEKTVEKTRNAAVKVGLKIKFVRETESGELDAEVTDTGGTLFANSLYVDDDVEPPIKDLDVDFPLVFGKLPTDLRPRVRKYRIRASVKLDVGNVSSDWVTLPEIPLEIPVVPVPTILALFDEGFSGRSLVVVPSPPLSALTTPTPIVSVGDALGITRSVLSIVAPGHPLVAFLDKPAGRAVTSFVQTADAKVVGAADVPWMWDHVYVQGFWFVVWIGRVTANDLMSSVVAIGAPETKFQMWTSNETLGVTPLELTIGPELHAAIPKLVDVRAKGNAAVTDGGRISKQRWNTDYDNTLSALRVIEVPDQ